MSLWSLTFWCCVNLVSKPFNYVNLVPTNKHWTKFANGSYELNKLLFPCHLGEHLEYNVILHLCVCVCVCGWGCLVLTPKCPIEDQIDTRCKHWTEHKKYKNIKKILFPPFWLEIMSLLLIWKWKIPACRDKTLSNFRIQVIIRQVLLLQIFCITLQNLNQSCQVFLDLVKTTHLIHFNLNIRLYWVY